jgi:hypothetical protein
MDGSAQEWAIIFNQLAIRFEDRFPLRDLSHLHTIIEASLTTFA